MTITLSLFLIQTLLFASHKRWPMVFFSVAGMFSYFLSDPKYLDIFSSTLMCMSICLVTMFLVYRNKTKDTLSQLILLLAILPCLGMLLYDQVMGSNIIFTHYLQLFTGIQILQLLSIHGGISDRINNFVLDIVSPDAGRGHNPRSSDGGETC